MEEEGEEDAADGADRDFFRPVSDTFLEARELLFVEVEMAGDAVDIFRLMADMSSKLERIRNNDSGHDKRNGECGGIISLEKPHGRDERSDIGGVGARHMAVQERVVADILPTVFSDEIEELDDFGHEESSEGDEKKRDRLGEFHNGFVRYYRFQYSTSVRIA